MRVTLEFHLLKWELFPLFKHDAHGNYEHLSTSDNKTMIKEKATWYYTKLKFLFFTITVIPKWNVKNWS